MKKLILSAGILLYTLLTNYAFSQSNTLDKLGLTSSTPSAVAYSLNQLSTAYTGSAIQVRRGSDNTTQDIGFTAGGGLDTAALKTFVGSNDGFVAIWYDQSGNARNLTQGDVNRQPAIVHSGVVYRRNGLPTLYHDQYDDGLAYTGADYMTSTPFTVNTIAGSNSSNGNARRAIQGASNWLIGPYGNNDGWHADGWNYYYGGNPWSLSRVESFTVIEPVSDPCIAWRDGALQTMTGNAKGVPYRLQTATQGAYWEPMDGFISELLGFNSELSATERLALDQSQKATYNIVSSNASLANIAISDGTLTPTFSSSNNNYTAIVDNQVATTFKVTPTGASTDATMQVQVNNGGFVTATNGAASPALSLNEGDNAVDIKSTAPDGSTTSTYSINVRRAPLPPTVQASNLTFTNTAALSATLNWSNGDGDTRAVFIAAASAGNAAPQPSVTYTQNSIFKTGTQIGSTGWYCVYKGTGSTVSITGLKANTTYRAMVVEFNGHDGTERFLTTDGTNDPANLITSGINALDKLGLDNTENSAGAIFSLRQLSSDYTGPLARIRVDNTYYDVYPDATGDKTFSLTSPISAGYNNYNDAKTGATANLLSSVVSSGTNATVAIWYDQSGNNNDGLRDDPNRQPAIINAGVIYTMSGKPAMKFNAQSSNSFVSANSVTISDGASVNAVAQNISSPNSNSSILTQNFTGNAIGFFLGHFGQNFSYAIYAPGFQQVNFNNDYPVLPFIATGIYGNSTVSLYVNRASIGSTGANPFMTSTNPFGISKGWDNDQGFDGYISEITLFTSGISTTQRQAIEASQYNYFGLGVPLPITNAVGNIKFAGASLSGKLASDFGNTITARGFVYGTNANPTLADHVITDAGTGLGDYATLATGLTPNTLYHFRAYATNTAGTGYGSDQTFTSLPAPYALDKIGLTNSIVAEGAFSMRLLSSTYAGPIARIQIDNTFYDVYPDASADKTFSLTSPISAVYNNWDAAGTGTTTNKLNTVVTGLTNARIVTWYDQTGYGNNAIQTDYNRQPDIIVGGAVTDENGRPAPRFVNQRATFLLTVKNATIVDASSANAVGQSINTPGGLHSLVSQVYVNGHIPFMLGHSGNTQGYIVFNGNFTQASVSGDYPLVPFVATGTYGDTNINFYLNGIAGTTAPTNSGIGADGPFYIGARWDSGESFDGYIPETIVFPTEISTATRQSIESNQITYYNIGGTGSLAATGTMTETSTLKGTPSANNTLTVSGTNLTAPLVVTPPVGFEASLDNSTFAPSVSISNSGTVAATPVYIRIAAATNLGIYGGNIVVSSVNTANVWAYIPVSTVSPIPNYLDKAGITATKATGAYSMRLLSSTYTGPLARITVGSNYYDVYPDATADKTFSLTSKISAPYTIYNTAPTGVTVNELSSIINNSTNATVAIWYDQSGYTYDVFQASTNNQPAIINNGGIYTENGRAALRFFNNTTAFTSAKSLTIAGASTANAVAQNISSSGGYAAMISQQYTGGAIGFHLGRFNGAMSYAIHLPGWSVASYTADLPTAPFNATGVYDGSSVNIFVNGIAGATASASVNQTVTNPIFIGMRWDGNDQFDGYIPEVTLFTTALSGTDRQAIENNQSVYYALTHPALTTDAVSEITGTKATLTGTAIADAGHVITSKGIVYSKTINPVIEVDSVITNADGLGAIQVAAKGLAPNTIYHYRSFAINSEGIGYGADKTFTTLAPPNYLDKAGLTATESTGAYSMRLLSTTYAGPLARINVNGTYYDVYPDASADKAFSLASTISASYTNYNDARTGATSNLLSSIINNSTNASVAIWYDQGGYAYDVLQASTNNQPAIINNGVIYTENSRAAMRFFGNASFFRSDKSVTIAGASSTNAVAQNISTGAGVGAIISQQHLGQAIGFLLSRFDNVLAYSIYLPNWAQSKYTTDIPTVPFNATGTYDGANVNLYVNGVASPTASATVNQTVTSPIYVGAAWDGGNYFDGYLPEVTLFTSSLSGTERQAIESSQDTYYSLRYPAVTTDAVSSITSSKATLTGTALSDAGNAVTSKGIVYGLAVNPIVGVDSVRADADGLGAITANATNLQASTLYHYRAFATNAEGTGYGVDKTFTTSLPPNILDKAGLTSADPATGAYALRVLSSTYTGPLARINIGGNYYDVYPDATPAKAFSLSSPISAAYNTYDAASTGTTANLLNSVIGGNSATVTIWYDQSASSNHAVQASTGNQPEIINNGAVDQSKGLPALKYQGGQSLIISQTFARIDHPNGVVNIVYQNTDQSTAQAIWGADNGNWDRLQLLAWPGNGSAFGLSNGGGTNSTPAVNTLDQVVYSAIMNYGTTNGTFVSVNGTDSQPYTEQQGDATDNIAIGAVGGYGGFPYVGYVSEFTLFFNQVPTANRKALEANQQIYYGVPAIVLANTDNVIALTANHWQASTAVSFNVSGIALTQAISITAPAQFEISTDNITFASSITVGAAGNLASTPIYVRLAATAPVGNYSGDITLTSGTISKTVAIPSSSVLFVPTTLDKLGLTSATPAAGAYSLRLLGNTYSGPLVRINIAGNYYDVYPDPVHKAFALTSPISVAYANNGDAQTGLTSNLLSSVIGSNTATVGIWYDQSAYNNNGVQNDSNLQPEVINAGTIDLDVTNSLPAIKFDGSKNLIVTSADFNNDLSGSVVYNATTDNNSSGGGDWYVMNGIFGSEQPGGTTDFGLGIFNGKFTVGNGPNDAAIGSGQNVNIGFTKINSWTRSNTNGSINLFTYGVADGSSTLNSGNRSAVPSIAIGSIQTFGGGGVFYHGTISELTMFPTVYNDTQRNAIEGSQITYYSIVNNSPPTDITLSASAINENVAAASTIGTFTTTDPEGGTMTYELVAGSGDTDNSAFTIDGDALKINDSPDYETKNSYTVRVRVTDNGGLSFEKQFTITINDLAEVVVDQASFASATVGTAYSESLTASGGTAPYSFAITAGTVPTGITLTDATLSGTPTASGTFNFTITATDANSFTGSKAYSIVVSAGTPAIIYAGTASKTYGDGDFDPAATSSNSSATITYSSSNTNIATIVDNKVHILKPGTVTIYADQAADGNYNAASQQSQVITIDKRALTLALNAAPAITKGYTGLTDATLVAGNYTLTGINGADNVTVSGTATYDTKDAGTGKTITADTFVLSGADKDNYTLSTASATTTGDITPASLIITADNQTKAYGAAVPTLTATYNGFVNSETAAVLTTPVTLSTTATAASHVAGSPYGITASGAVSNNYSITYAAGSLTITPVGLTIAADNQTKTYGATNPALTATYTGFVNGDTNASLTTPPTLSTTATSASPVNTYPIIAGGAVSSDYTISYTAGTLTVGKANLTITADNKSKTYGQGLTGGSGSTAFTVTGLQNSETVGSVAINYGTGSATNAAVNTYTQQVTPSFATGGTFATSNYDITYAKGDIIVGTQTITVTADAKSKTYGDVDPTLTYTSTPALVSGDSFTGALSRVAGENIGTRSITKNTLALNSNYVLNYTGADLTIGAKTITVTADAKSKTYGDVDPTLTYTATPALVSGDSFTGALSRVAGENIGTRSITKNTLALNSNYVLNYTGADLTIGAKTITVTAAAKSKTYGDVDPALTYTSTPTLVSDDSFTGALSRVAGENIGTKSITKNTLALTSNYVLNYTGADLTIGAKTITVTAAAKSKTYGDVDPALTYTSTPTLVSGDSFTGALSRVAGENIGTRSITKNTLALSSNYVLNYTGADLTIGAKTITVTAAAKSKTYGDVDPTLTYTATPALISGDSFTGTLSRVAGENAGTYAINKNTVALSGNYTLNYTAANLIVAKAALTIAADSKTKLYGVANPALTATYSGFVKSDNSASLTTRPVLATTATVTSAVGTYPITATGAASPNYTITYLPGVLTVGNVVLTVTANAKSKTYGAANPALTVSYSGFVNGDGPASVTTPPAITTTATVSSAAGSYPVTASGAVIPGYSIVYKPGTLTVNKAALTITADNKAKLYGTANPALTVNYSGFVNGDNAASLTTQPTVANTATATTAPGAYPIAVSGAASSNYTITNVNGTLTIIPLTNAALGNLTASTGTISPVFASGTTVYELPVSYDTERLSLTLTYDATASATVNGTAVPNGSPSFTVNIPVGSSTITLVVTAQDGTTKTTYKVNVYKATPPTAIIPTNILTPNGDGKNDGWVIKDIERYPDNQVTIYDRAGREIYKKKGYHNDWTGTLSGAPLAQGTYYYIVELAAGITPIKGFITILKNN